MLYSCIFRLAEGSAARGMSKNPETAFLEAIREAPDDDTPRVVYADWLDDRNQPGDTNRAAFIRVQCRLAQMAANDPTRAGLEQQVDALLQRHRSEWERPLRELGSTEVQFRRGFAYHITIPADAFMEHAEQLFDQAPPIRSVNLTGLYSLEQVQALAGSPCLSNLSTLSLARNRIGNEGAEALAGSPHLQNLAELHLGSNFDIPPTTLDSVEQVIAGRRHNPGRQP